MGVPPTWEEWFDWFLSKNEGHQSNGDYWFTYVPVGDVWSLFVLALLYMLVIFVKRLKNKVSSIADEQ